MPEDQQVGLARLGKDELTRDELRLACAVAVLCVIGGLMQYRFALAGFGVLAAVMALMPNLRQVARLRWRSFLASVTSMFAFWLSADIPAAISQAQRPAAAAYLGVVLGLCGLAAWLMGDLASRVARTQKEARLRAGLFGLGRACWIASGLVVIAATTAFAFAVVDLL